MKATRQDNIGVSPLKKERNLISDSKGKANILVEPFQSVFTKVTDSIMPNMSNRPIPKNDKIVIESKGVEKLLSNFENLQFSTTSLYSKFVLKGCAKELSVGLNTIF